MLTLGIETSCDDTGVALLEDGQLLANEVASQYEVHEPYGGVVPELAARAHLENLPRVLELVLEKADRDLGQVDLVAVTAGPGLLISLLVGLAEAKGLALGLGKPLVAVNHLRAHLYAARMAHPELQPPYLGLLVSGGHTSLVRVEAEGLLHSLGKTRDDAAGECFDKVARVAGLGAVGGPAIQKAARGGDPRAFRFPRSRVKGAPLDFSFSGLKTAASRKFEAGEMKLADFCASFQEAVIDNLMKRVELALDEGEVGALSAAGGVAASVLLKEKMQALADSRGLPFLAPPLSLCTDNAGMIAGLGAEEFLRRGPNNLDIPATSSLGFRQPGEARGKSRG
jgi:N6-L-threonylcarbamoyladenine synthase